MPLFIMAAFHMLLIITDGVCHCRQLCAILYIRSLSHNLLLSSSQDNQSNLSHTKHCSIKLRDIVLRVPSYCQTIIIEALQIWAWTADRQSVSERDICVSSPVTLSCYLLWEEGERQSWHWSLDPFEALFLCENHKHAMIVPVCVPCAGPEDVWAAQRVPQQISARPEPQRSSATVHVLL